MNLEISHHNVNIKATTVKPRNLKTFYKYR